MTEASDGHPRDLTNPALIRLFEHWRGLCGARPMPARADLDPADIAFILGNVLLVDVLHEPQRFRVRLHGTNMVMRAGYDLTGRFIDELPNAEFREATAISFAHVVEKRAPRAWTTKRMIGDRWMNYDTLMLPLSSDGALIDMLLVGFIYRDA